MADFSFTPEAGGDFYFDETGATAAAQSNQLKTFTNIAGAAVSLALVVGVSYWGYQLMVRDVSGIPVVRAAAGEMRVRPEEPGGQLAQNQGLSVNEVASIGTANTPADQLRLAPQPMDLAGEDQPMTDEMVASMSQQNTPDADAVASALASGNVDNIVAQLTAGIAPIEDMSGDETLVVASLTETEAAPAVVVNDGGMRVSLRPTLRPTRRSVRTASLGGIVAPPSGSEEVDPASVPAGTRLVQLGAFESPEVARVEWDKLSLRFSAYLDGKQRLVQKAKSGGRTFYRLRAVGFADIGDARRFCSALVAENADCIPVVSR